MKLRLSASVALVLLVACNKDSPAPAPNDAEATAKPGGALTEEIAAKALAEELPKGLGSRCAWEAVTQLTSTTWAATVYDELEQKCAAQMEKAGFIRLGECTEKLGQKCWKRRFDATGEATIDRRGAVLFPCGTIKLEKVDSVATKGNEATVRYTRTYAVHEQIKSDLEACKLTHPEPGTATRKYKFVRTDDGKWLPERVVP